MIGSSEIYDTRLSSRGYRFQHKLEKGAFPAYANLKFDPAKPWAVEMDFEVVDLAPKGAFGMLFGQNRAEKNDHVFMLRLPPQLFYISKRAGGAYEHRVSACYTPAVGDWHVTLRVEQAEGYWHYFVDDWLVYLHPAELLDGLGFGFMVQGQATVDVSRLKVQSNDPNLSSRVAAAQIP